MLRSAALDRCDFSAVGSYAHSKQQALQCRIPFSTAQPLSRRHPGRHCRGVHCAAWQRSTVRHASQRRRPRTSALADASVQPGQTAPSDERADDNFLVARVRGVLKAFLALHRTQEPRGQRLHCQACNVRACACKTLSHRTTSCRVPDVAEQQQAPQVAVAHHLGAHPGRPGHDAHAAGWAPLTSAAALVNLPAQACMCTSLSSAQPGRGCSRVRVVRSCTPRRSVLAPLATCATVNCRQDPLAQHAGAAVAGGAALAGRGAAHRQLRGHGLHHPGGNCNFGFIHVWAHSRGLNASVAIL